MLELPRSRVEINAIARRRYRSEDSVGFLIHTLAASSLREATKIHNLPENIYDALAAAATEYWIVGEVFLRPIGDKYFILNPDNVRVKKILKKELEEQSESITQAALEECNTAYELVDPETDERKEIDCIHILRRISKYDIRGTTILNPDGSINSFRLNDFEESLKEATKGR